MDQLQTSSTLTIITPGDPDYNYWNNRNIHSGGVPVPGKNTGGCIIAHPDNDLADTNWNKSGVPWHTFYYQDNYPRLQQAKAKWDPLNIFQHTLSVQPT